MILTQHVPDGTQQRERHAYASEVAESHERGDGCRIVGPSAHPNLAAADANSGQQLERRRHEESLLRRARAYDAAGEWFTFQGERRSWIDDLTGVSDPGRQEEEPGWTMHTAAAPA